MQTYAKRYRSTPASGHFARDTPFFTYAHKLLEGINFFE